MEKIDKNKCSKCQKDISNEFFGLFECTNCGRRYCMYCVGIMQSESSSCKCGSIALSTV